MGIQRVHLYKIQDNVEMTCQKGHPRNFQNSHGQLFWVRQPKIL